MTVFTLVTGNKHKLAEWQRLLPSDFELENIELDLDEIQSLDLEAIIADKVQRAYEVAHKPVVVEDVAAGLDELGGLPGPFMKFFEQQLGKSALFQLAQAEHDPATVRCAMAYYDGKELITVQSKVLGKVVPARGKNGFGFDYCFVPQGQTKTYAEMGPATKDAIGHRGLAVRELIKKLHELG